MFWYSKSIEYDPNRSARISLIAYLDGEKDTSSVLSVYLL